MKRVLPLLSRVLTAALIVVGVASCESTSTNGHKKKKVVTAEQFDAQQGGLSGLPWNRPRAFESGSGMGRMMPQSR